MKTMNYMDNICIIMYVNHVCLILKNCIEKLNYSQFIDRFNGGIDILLIP